MYDTASGEKISIRKIKLVKPEIGMTVVVGSFTNADNFLTAWRSSSKDWFTCKFEVEYLDGHVLTGEYRKFIRSSARLSLSNHIRSAFRKVQESSELDPHFRASFEDSHIRFWEGNCPSCLNADFLARYEIEDFCEP